MAAENESATPTLSLRITQSGRMHVSGLLLISTSIHKQALLGIY